MGIFVSKEQYKQACSADLYAFLVRNHPAAVKAEYGSVLLLADKHVSVKQGFHGYRNFRTDETGNNIDYLMNFLGYGYQDAVLALIEESVVCGSDCVDLATRLPVLDASDSSKKVVLPAPLKGRFRNLYAFLVDRKIPSDVIQRFIDEGIMYQSAEGNNIVFCSPAGDYCELRGTNSYADRRCKERTACEQFRGGEHGWCQQMDICPGYKADPFHGCRKTRADRFWWFASMKDKPSEIVYVCEAAIDAISLYVIHRAQRKTENAVYVSIGGVANQKTIDRIKTRKAGRVVLAVDNDQAGQDCRERNPDLPYILPSGKDWNDDLRKGDY